MDRTVYAGSAIGRLPRILRPLALTARGILDAYARRGYPHQADGMMTRHNDGFLRDTSFQKAYARSVKAGGWDFGIPYRVHQALWCASIAPEGSFVELGTGRGFIMSAVMTQNPDRTLHLFDTFASEYLDDEGKVIEEASGYYATTFDAVEKNFSEWRGVHFHRGDVFETLPRADLGTIAFLHVDLNHHEPEEFGVRHIWPRMTRGAVILFDDYAYATHDRQYEAVNALGRELGFPILSTPSGQGIAIKT